MALRTLTTAICDECGQEMDWPRGWLTLAPLDVSPPLAPHTPGSAALAALQQRPTTHFCSESCLRAYLKQRKRGAG